jgi:aldose 1-epimerase
VLPPSGEQFLLASGSARAVVTEVGATLRLLELGGQPVLLSFGEDELCRDGRGQVLAPWPNRLGDGRYRFGDVDGVVALNEPERHNAIHGLIRWSAFRPAMKSASEVVLETLHQPQPAYPWRLRLVVLYGLTEEEVSVSVVATNESATPAPFGIGFHPYFAARNGADRASVSLPAARHLLLDERGLPRGIEATAASAHGALLDGLAPLGDAVLDDCFTGLEMGVDGRWAASFRPDAAALRTVVVRGDAAFGHVMLYSADQLGGDERRSAVAIEPMTCPPDAFRSGEGLVTLEPDEEFRAGFSISLGAQ